MAEEETHRIQIEVPKSWLPDLEDAKNAADRSRHYMFLRFIREGLDAFSASTSEPEMENRSSSV